MEWQTRRSWHSGHLPQHYWGCSRTGTTAARRAQLPNCIAQCGPQRCCGARTAADCCQPSLFEHKLELNQGLEITITDGWALPDVSCIRPFAQARRAQPLVSSCHRTCSRLSSPARACSHSPGHDKPGGQPAVVLAFWRVPAAR